jgi:hypothetical protein
MKDHRGILPLKRTTKVFRKGFDKQETKAYADEVKSLKDAEVIILKIIMPKDEIILDLVFGKFRPAGKPLFELPASMQAVLYQKEDLPRDSRNPQCPFGPDIT